MPQLDKVSFFPQLFWLVLSFLVFYILSVKYFLPTISKSLKIRSKVVQLQYQSLHTLDTEATQIIQAKELAILPSIAESKNALQSTTTYAEKWYQDSSRKLNEQQLITLNEEYIKSVAELAAKRYLVTLCSTK